MPASVMPWWRPQFFDANGDPLASGTIETYESGTSTPLATYSDSNLTVTNGLILTLNSGGFPQVSGTEVSVFLLPVAYRFVLKNSAGTTVRTVDNIYPAGVATSVNVDIADAVFGENVSANDLVYLSDGSGARTGGRWYRADADVFAYSLHVSLGFATVAALSGATGTVRTDGVVTGMSGLSAGATYYVSGTAGALTATAPTNARPVGMAISATSLLIDFSSMWIDPLAFVCDGRLTLTTALPVTVADVLAATTLRFTPYKGNRIALFDGSRWKLYAFAELSIAVPATTVTMYDVFVYDNAGTLTLELTAWTNDTTRATALVLQDGVLVKTAATTRRYVGSFRTTGVSGQTEDSFAKRYVWNYYNRVTRPMRALEAADSWTYTTATWRQANANAANQLDFVIGVAEVEVSAQVVATFLSDAAGRRAAVGIGIDTTSALTSGTVTGAPSSPVAAYRVLVTASLRVMPAVGRHIAVWLEQAVTAAGTTTWEGDGGDPATIQSGIHGSLEG